MENTGLKGHAFLDSAKQEGGLNQGDASSQANGELCFILGKNSRLSLAELIAYFSSRGIGFEVTDFGKQFAILSFDGNHVIDIESFGGTLKVCNLLGKILTKDLEAFAARKDKRPAWLESFRAAITGEKVNGSQAETRLLGKIDSSSRAGKEFGVSVYVSDLKQAGLARSVYRVVGNKLKEMAGSKAKYMGFPASRALPQLTNVEVIKKGFVESSAEFIVAIGKDTSYLAVTSQAHNPFEFQKRDTARPAQRPILGISPRLARIMVNLSQARPGQRLLDPFCGYGTILQEAALAGLEVVGVDNDRKCVLSARQNLAWLGKEYKKEFKPEVFEGDSTALEKRLGSFDSIVGEPPMGPPLEKRPEMREARASQERLKQIYIKFLKSAAGVLKPGCRLVMTLPSVVTNTRAVVPIDPRELANRSGLQLEKAIRPESLSGAALEATAKLQEMFFLQDYDEKDLIRRHVVVFRKP